MQNLIHVRENAINMAWVQDNTAKKQAVGLVNMWEGRVVGHFC